MYLAHSKGHIVFVVCFFFKSPCNLVLKGVIEKSCVCIFWFPTFKRLQQVLYKYDVTRPLFKSTYFIKLEKLERSPHLP